MFIENCSNRYSQSKSITNLSIKPIFWSKTFHRVATDETKKPKINIRLLRFKYFPKYIEVRLNTLKYFCFLMKIELNWNIYSQSSNSILNSSTVPFSGQYQESGVIVNTIMLEIVEPW